MEGSEGRKNRKGRPLRRVLGVLAAAVGTADIIFSGLGPDNEFGVPAVDPQLQPFLLGYGVFLYAVAIFAVATSFGRKAKKAKKGKGGVPVDGIDLLHTEAECYLHRLRAHGWFVADNVSLPHADIDHIAIGPAGIIVAQQLWSTNPDPRGNPAARARIAAEQLRKLYTQKEIHVEVVPAVLAYGPGQQQTPGGVKVIDNVAVLMTAQADEWVNELAYKQLVDFETEHRAREVIADILEGVPADKAGSPAVFALTAG